MRVPSESVANASIPRSMPVSRPVAGKGCIGISVQETQAYHPSSSHADGDSFGRPFQWTVQANGSATNLGEAEETTVQRRATMLADLWIGEAVVAITPTKARISRFLATLHPAEERLIGLVQPMQHILQDLRVDVAVLWARILDVG